MCWLSRKVFCCIVVSCIYYVKSLSECTTDRLIYIAHILRISVQRVGCFQIRELWDTFYGLIIVIELSVKSFVIYCSVVFGALLQYLSGFFVFLYDAGD